MGKDANVPRFGRNRASVFGFDINSFSVLPRYKEVSVKIESLVPLLLSSVETSLALLIDVSQASEG